MVAAFALSLLLAATAIHATPVALDLGARDVLPSVGICVSLKTQGVDLESYVDVFGNHPCASKKVYKTTNKQAAPQTTQEQSHKDGAYHTDGLTFVTCANLNTLGIETTVRLDLTGKSLCARDGDANAKSSMSCDDLEGLNFDISDHPDFGCHSKSPKKAYKSYQGQNGQKHAGSEGQSSSMTRSDLIRLNIEVSGDDNQSDTSLVSCAELESYGIHVSGHFDFLGGNPMCGAPQSQSQSTKSFKSNSKSTKSNSKSIN